MKQLDKGVTLVEVLTVIGISIILTAIALPVVFRAKKSAHIVDSIAKLHNLHVATMIYRTDYDGDGVYGDIGSMGLPSVEYVSHERFGLPREALQSSCGLHPSETPHEFTIDYFPGMGGSEFTRQALLFQDNMILYFDMNCTDPGVSLGNVNASRFGIGVFLSGQIIKRRRKGYYWAADWWIDPQ